ncbi:hypothetical protein BH09MYX1_BH09MYX1_28470 [soil metagenome]
MRSAKDVEAYLKGLNRKYTPVEDQPGTFLVTTNASMPPVAIRVDPPLVVLRVHIGVAPQANHAPLFHKLLSLNAKQLVHTSYGIDDNRIVLSAAHELENLDFNEIEATLDEIDLALTQQVPELLELSKQSK